MGANASRVQRHFDTAEEVTLRAEGGSDITGDALQLAVSLNELRAYWHNYEIPNGKMVIPVNVTKADTGGTNAYSLQVLVDDVEAMNDSPVEVARLVLKPGALGNFEIVVDSKAIPALDTDHSGSGKWLALKALVSGNGTPKLNFHSWIAKSFGA